MDVQKARAPQLCPFCGGGVEIVRLHCQGCGTTFDGRFAQAAFGNLRPEQWVFVETFIRCRGKIKDVEVALDLSYPTVVSRLNDVLATLGIESAPEAPTDAGAATTSERKRHLLERLRRGELAPKDALRLLDG